MIQGVVPILQTPFHQSGELDVDSLRSEVRYCQQAGAEGVCFPGFASEWWKLSDQEILTGAKVVIEAREGNLKVVCNVTAQSTYVAVEQAKKFAGMGCDALMCLPPFVVPSGPKAVLAHLRAVMAAAEIPHIIQYAASLTGVRLDPEEMLSLKREFPHFCSIKVDFIPPGPALTELKKALEGHEFTFFIGYSGLQLADAVRRGAQGLMGGAGHAAEDVAVLRALQSGDEEAGRRAFEKLLPMLNFEMQTIDLLIAVHKRLLEQKGVVASDHVRAPRVRLDGYQEAELERHSESLSALREEFAATSHG